MNGRALTDIQRALAVARHVTAGRLDGKDGVDLALELAGVWQHALTSSFYLGYGEGFDRGVIAGRAEESDAWQKIIGVYRETIAVAPLADIERARQQNDNGCRQRCGACSRCIRQAAVQANVQRFGVSDYPGVRGQPVIA